MFTAFVLGVFAGTFLTLMLCVKPMFLFRISFVRGHLADGHNTEVRESIDAVTIRPWFAWFLSFMVRDLRE